MSETINTGYVICADASLCQAQITSLSSLLSSDERANIARLRVADDRYTRTVAHALKRTVLAKRLGVLSGDLQFGQNAYGKPMLLHSQWQCNLSHSQQYIVFGYCQHSPVGVDVEVVRSSLPIHEIAQRYFYPLECEMIAQSADPVARFYQLWVVKEAVIKAQGVGLAHHLASVNFTLTDDVWVLQAVPAHFSDISHWYVHQFSPFQDTYAAIATLSPIKKLHVNILPEVAF